MKKLKFKDFFLKNLIIFTIIGIIVAAGIFASGYYFMDAVFEMQSMVMVSEAKNHINNQATNKPHRNWTLGLYFDSAVNKDMGVDAAGIIFDSETKEIIATSEFNGYAIIPKEYSNTGKGIFLMNKSEEYRDVIEKLNQENYDMEIEIQEIYLDGEEFYPGRVLITLYGEEPAFNIVGEPLEYDFTPENTSDYEKIDYHKFPLEFGTLRNSRALSNLLSNPDGFESERNGFEFYSSSEIIIDGKSYIFASLHYMDFWGFFAPGIIICLIIFVIIIMVIELLYAWKKYKKYLTQYEIDEYRRTMTNALAHDLKSPLTAIYGYAENLKNNVHSEKKDYYADAVLENVQYMNEIITNTLDLAKLEISDKGLKKEKVDITALAEELYTKYKPQAENRDIAFKISGKAVVTADRKMITQAVENLISNAVKYTEDGGEIVVSANDKSFEISNLCGDIPNAKTLDKPFEKADQNRSNRKGSGLGLSIVKNIAMLHKFGFETKAENNIFTAKITF